MLYNASVAGRIHNPWKILSFQILQAAAITSYYILQQNITTNKIILFNINKSRVHIGSLVG
jgi:hypothetical protein